MTEDFTAKYEDEYRWWDTYLHGSIRPWYRGEHETINYYYLVPCPPERGPDTPQAAALEFRRCVAPMYFERSWELDTARHYGHVLDLGCGPLIPSADLAGLTFGVDPNLPAYRAMGYPVDQYGAVLVPHAAARRSANRRARERRGKTPRRGRGLLGDGFVKVEGAPARGNAARGPRLLRAGRRPAEACALFAFHGHE